MADRAGAEFSGNPLYLRNALYKLEDYSRNVTMSRQHQNPAYSHMFIVNPLAGLSKFQDLDLFRTHPATEDRIRELEKMARQENLL